MSRTVLYAIIIAFVVQMIFWMFPPAAEAHIGAGIVVDRAGRVYFLDTLRGRVWMVDAAGRVKSLAEHKHGDVLVIGQDGAVYCEDVVSGGVWKITSDGAATEVVTKATRSAMVGWTYFLTVGADGSLYFVSGYPDQVRLFKMNPTGDGVIIAGSTRGTADGPAREAQFREVRAAAWGQEGALFLIDGDSIRKLSAEGRVTTVAGSAVGGFADGAGTLARFQHPTGLALDTRGNIYVADYGNRRVRKITRSGEVSTVTNVGETWTPIGIAGVATADGDLYVLERFGLYNSPSSLFTWFGDIAGNPRVRKISAEGTVVTVASIRGLTELGVTTGLLTFGAAAVFSAIVWLIRSIRRRRARRVELRPAAV
jgi:sugar lactone lactonase YvrE